MEYNTTTKSMSNKQETPVSWLVFELSKVGYLPDGLPTDIHNIALEMESQKQQKYDEMLAMLEECFRFTKIVQDPATSALVLRNEIEQLIKKVKEL